MSDEHIELQIECLEFEGVDVREPARAEAAFRHELLRLVTERERSEAGPSPRATREIDAGTLSRSDLDTPERLGRVVARRVYAELFA